MLMRTEQNSRSANVYFLTLINICEIKASILTPLLPLPSPLSHLSRSPPVFHPNAAATVDHPRVKQLLPYAGIGGCTALKWSTCENMRQPR